MSAETLRKAAKLMRERAEFARAGEWFAAGDEVRTAWQFRTIDIARCDGSLPEGNRLNARHIASWHPAVALTVADWLNRVAVDGDHGYDESDDNYRAAMDVALAYLREES